MNADDKFQTLVTHVETILAAENVQWAEYTATAKKSRQYRRCSVSSPGLK